MMVAASAWVGIAATLLIGGCTVHTVVCLKIQVYAMLSQLQSLKTF